MEEAVLNWRQAWIYNSISTLVTRIENKNRENLYTVVARKLGIPVDATILYYKNNYVTSRTIFDNVDITLHLAVKESDNPEVMQLCRSRFVTCLFPIIILDEAGIPNKGCSLYYYTFVKDIMDEISDNKLTLNGIGFFTRANT